MELAELEQRLERFARAMYEDPEARVSDVAPMPGHAGFSWGFAVASRGRREAWYLRLPPPNVRWQGTADVLRQVAALEALEGTPVPHCRVRWAGDDLRWFGRPYFVVPKLAGGDVLRLRPGEWGSRFDANARRAMAREAMAALAALHRIDWAARAPRLGPPLPLPDDVRRWDRFLARLAEPRLAPAPRARERLLARVPTDSPIGIFHGDYQTSNLFYSEEGRLLAVLDWELVGIGATLTDVGWIATFNDPAAWATPGGVTGFVATPEELIAAYREHVPDAPADLAWYRALAAYKFAVITGLNLDLHRRGKRPDPMWEETAPSMETLLERALELLG